MIPGTAWLFCPADRPDRFTKASECADAVILDLEDAVLPADKAHARQAAREAQFNPDTTIIRVNPADSAEYALDLAVLHETHYRYVMLAKSQSAAQLDSLNEAGYQVVALCETPIGIAHSEEIAAHPACIALMWGAEDLVAGLGGRSSRLSDGRYRDVARYARSRVLIAASSAGKAAVDAVHLDIADLTGLADEASDAAAVGFVATACIHPSQVSTIRDAYRPTAQEMRWATAMLEDAPRHAGAFRFRGRMVDEVVLRQARTIVEFDTPQTEARA